MVNSLGPNACSVYKMCNPRQVSNFSVPQFLHKIRLIIVTIVIMTTPVNIGKALEMVPGI